MVIKMIKMKRKNICYFILFTIINIGFVEPNGIYEAAHYLGGVWIILNYLSIICSYISVAIIILLTIKYKIMKRIKNISFIIFLYYAFFLLVSDLLNEVTLYSDAKNLIFAICFMLIIEYSIERNCFNYMVKVFVFWMSLFVLINFFLILVTGRKGLYIDSRGWDTNYLLGYRNVMIYYMLPFLALLGIYTKKKVVYLSFVGLCLFSVLLTSSSTSTFSMVIILIGSVLYSKKRLPMIFSPIKVFTGSFIISWLFIFINFQSRFANIISMLFQKDSSFSDRTLIWGSSLLNIAKNPIFGNGSKEVPLSTYYIIGQCHNRYLDVLYVGGSVLLIIFCIFIIYSLYSRRDLQQLNLMKIVFWGYAIIFIMEGRRPDYIFFVLIYMFSILKNSSNYHEKITQN